MRQLNMAFATLAILFASSTPLHAQSTCNMDALKGQQHDVATIQRLENAWSVAYLKADTNFELCLLSKDFTEIVRSGDVKFLSDELAFARKNEGKNLPIPKLPEPTVLLHDNVAVAYGTSEFTGADGKSDRLATQITMSGKTESGTHSSHSRLLLRNSDRQNVRAQALRTAPP